MNILITFDFFLTTQKTKPESTI
nr:NADH-plastoquinone oxidoreductase subunit K [Zygophyllum kansuense]UJH21913.1 NADH-plastoquinone oxidoreductase subunit K [Zygophyllum kansuense]